MRHNLSASLMLNVANGGLTLMRGEIMEREGAGLFATHKVPRRGCGDRACMHYRQYHEAKTDVNTEAPKVE
jgi:hypothetical protein